MYFVENAVPVHGANVKLKLNFEVAKQQFDYEEGVNTLRTLGVQSPRPPHIERQTSRMEFLSLTGSIVRQGSEQEKRAMRRALCADRTTEAGPK